MKEPSRQTFKECLSHFWVFFWLWVVVSGFAVLIIRVVMAIFSIEAPIDSDDFSFLLWKWGFVLGMGCFSIMLILAYLNGLSKLAKYKKDLVVYTEEKELKEFISQCKSKKA